MKKLYVCLVLGYFFLVLTASIIKINYGGEDFGKVNNIKCNTVVKIDSGSWLTYIHRFICEKSIVKKGAVAFGKCTYLEIKRNVCETAFF